MKKILLIATCLVAMPVLAQNCNYSREQEIVRSAENLEEVKALGSNFDANATFPCGGTLSQLAVLRGSLDSLDYLHAHGADFNTMVSLKGYEIPGAPEEIPFPLFVARFSPNSVVVDAMVNSGINFKVEDSMGHDVFWYFDRNPVLRHTYLTKKGWDSLIPVTERLRRIKNEGK